MLVHGQEICFRDLKVSDAKTYLDFRKLVPHESTHTMQYVGAPLPTEEELTQTILKSCDSSDNFLIGAFSGERLIGLVNLRRERADHPWVKHIGNFGMMILKEFWGQGIGKKLLKILDDTAKDAGITRIQGEVRTQNLRGVNLYKKSGYQIEGTRINAAFIDGSFQDCFYIAKNVPETQKCDWQPPVLETARLILRPLAMTDAAHIFSYAKNPNVSRTTLWDPHTSIEDSTSFIRDYAFKKYQQEEPEPWGVALKTKPDHVFGTVGCFWDSKEYKSMELAYTFAEEYWGQGIATEAAREALKYCALEYKPLRIQARCKSDNFASAKVMQNIGMSLEGTLRSSRIRRGEAWDMTYYAKIYG